MTNRLSIDCISDTHSKHSYFQLPEGDILIHAGDCTSTGQFPEALVFLDWFNKQSYRHRILIAGNHDFIFEKQPEQMLEECQKRHIHLLNDSGVEIHGIKIWGSPITPWFENWAFNRHRGDEIKAHWDLIPSDTEILITHGPCYGILDEVKISRQWTRHVGCEELEKNIHASQIKLHVFGHIHGARNVKTHAGKIFVNAASLNDSYKPYRPGFTRLFKQNERYVF